MKQTTYIIMAGMVMLFAACNKEKTPDVVVHEDGSVDITVVIDQEDGTKATLSDPSGSSVTGVFAFSSGDAIAIGTSKGMFTGSNAFGGNADVNKFRVYGLNNTSDDGLVAFPADIVTDISNTSISFTLPSSYTFSEVGNASAASCLTPVPMIGTYTHGNKVTMKQAGAVVRFRFQPSQIGTGSIRFQFGSNVTGDVTLSSPTPASSSGTISTLTGSTGSTITVSISSDEYSTFSEREYIYITLPVPAGTRIDDSTHPVLVTYTGPSTTKTGTIAPAAKPSLSRAHGYRASVSVTDSPTINYLEVAYPRWTNVADSSPIDGPFNEYADGEFFGVFAVDNTSKTVVYANVPMAAHPKNLGSSFDDGSNNSRIRLSTPDAENYPLSANYTYFVYYPYRAENPTDKIIEMNVAVEGVMPTAEQFFSCAVANWTVSGTQNSAGTFKGQDLQIARVVGPGYPTSRLSVTPVHKMSLVKLTLGETAVTTDVYNYDADHTTPSVKHAEAHVMASSVMDATTTARMYSAEGGYWTIVKATGGSSNETLTLNSATGAANGWSSSVSVGGSDMGYGKYKRYTATSGASPSSIWNFAYNTNKACYSVTLSEGTYLLEVWGASGGTLYGDAGKGGYSYGQYTVSSGNTQTLYVCVGGAGTHYPSTGSTGYGDQYAGYNGGGGGQAGGGGATHMATCLRSTGVLTEYASYQSEVLLVAGGAGNGDLGIGGDGGGGNENGGDGSTSTKPWHDADTQNGRRAAGVGRGGTSSAGGVGYSGDGGSGSFGKGGNCNSSGDSAGGGGGGWYGGGSSTMANHGPGGGGSGHINTSVLTHYGGSSGVWGYSEEEHPDGYTSFTYYKIGKHGQARITKLQ